MNRSMRRAEKYKKKLHDVVVNLPPMIDEWTVFDIPTRILQSIATGEINAVNGKPVCLDNEGNWCEICPALSGWIFTWQHITSKMQLKASLLALSKLHNKLLANMPLQLQDVKSAQEEMHALRKIFRNSDRSRIKELAQQAQILILMDK